LRHSSTLRASGSQPQVLCPVSRQQLQQQELLLLLLQHGCGSLWCL
jgi:hypothetical protein